MNEEQINHLAREILRGLMSEERADRAKSRCFLVFEKKWHNRYYMIFDEMKIMTDYEFYAVVPEGLMHPEQMKKIKAFESWRDIIPFGNRTKWPGEDFITIFPEYSRNLLVRTAIGMDDCDSSKWIRHAMELGQKIAVLKSGLENFTGREPQMYTKNILGYYKTLKEYNIDMVDSIREIDKENE